MFRYCLQTAILLYVTAISYAAKSPFYFGHVYTIPYSSNATEALAAVQLASDTINNISLLNNYNVILTSTLKAQVSKRWTRVCQNITADIICSN